MAEKGLRDILRGVTRRSRATKNSALNLAKRHRFLVLGITGLAILTFLTGGLWKFLNPVTFSERKDFVQLVAQILGGIAVLAGAVFAWQRIEVSREEQITERFTRAIDQLGSDKLEVRLGGIYALERIAKDSEKDCWAIMEVLTTYLRENARKDPENGGALRERLPADIQAILTVLGRRTTIGETLNLSKIDIRGAQLLYAHLERAILSRSNLEKANLAHAYLDGSYLIGTDLRDAYLFQTDLSESELYEADLRGADLREANLHGAKFGNLDRLWPDSPKTDLRGTDLTNVVGLTWNQIECALVDEETKLPEYLQVTDHE